MAWMSRWLTHLLARFGGTETGTHWVEPSNAITRAVLSGQVPELATAVVVTEPAVEEAELPLPAEEEQPVAPAAQRSGRRRSRRAA